MNPNAHSVFTLPEDMTMPESKVLVLFTAVLIVALGFPDSARAGAGEQQTITRAKKRVTAAMQMQEMQASLEEQTKAVRALQQPASVP